MMSVFMVRFEARELKEFGDPELTRNLRPDTLYPAAVNFLACVFAPSSFEESLRDGLLLVRAGRAGRVPSGVLFSSITQSSMMEGEGASASMARTVEAAAAAAPVAMTAVTAVTAVADNSVVTDDLYWHATGTATNPMEVEAPAQTGQGTRTTAKDPSMPTPMPMPMPMSTSTSVSMPSTSMPSMPMPMSMGVGVDAGKSHAEYYVLMEEEMKNNHIDFVVGP
jgi:hypothetical protein